MKILKIIITSTFLSVLLLAGLFVAGHFGFIDFYKPFVVTSGSMEPAIPTGSVVLVRPKIFGYAVGDIITFKQANKNTVTHRVHQLENFGNDIAYITKGDANEEPDSGHIEKGQVLGVVSYSVPHLGYLVQKAQTPYGFILLVIVPATIIVYEELKNLWHETISGIKKLTSPKKKPQNSATSNHFSQSSDSKTINLNHSSAAKKSSTPSKLAIILPVVGAVFIITSISAAYFTDIEESLGNILQASDTWAAATPTPTPISTLSPTPVILPTPTPTPTATTSAQPGDVIINEINWTGSNGDGLDEWVELVNTTATPIDISNWYIENLGTGNGVNKNLIIPPGKIIPATGYFIISNKAKSGSRINVDSDLVDTNVALSDGGEQLVLKNSSDVTIDTANGLGAWFAGSNSTPKKSMEQTTPGSDGTLSTSWQTATTHTNMDNNGPTDEFGTPKAANGL